MALPVIVMQAVPIIGTVGLVLVACIKEKNKGIIDLEMTKGLKLLIACIALVIICAIIAMATMLVSLIMNTNAYIVTLAIAVVIGGVMFLRSCKKKK